MLFNYRFILEEEERKQIFEALQEENLADFFLYEVENPTVDNFLFTTNPEWAVTIGVYHENKLACVAIVSPTQNKSGLFHFCFTRNYFPYGIEVGKQVVSMLWDIGFESLMGITPKVFRHVFPIAKGVGFTTHVAEVQGMCRFAKQDKYVTGIISIINKE